MNVNALIRRGKRFLCDRDYRFAALAARGWYDSMRDEEYLKRQFQAEMGKPLDLEHPQTYNEKLQWLKLHNHDPRYTVLVDKYRVRDVIAKELGEEYLIPLLGVWEDPEEIDFDALPQQFVLKCNHNSGVGMCICTDKTSLDIPQVKAELRKGLAQDYYLTGREWPYKDVPRKIIAEQYIEDSNGELNDYKFFCFDGYVDNVMVVADRTTGDPHFYHFDRNWRLCQYNRLCRSLPKDYTIPKPDTMDQMFELAAKLSKGMPHVRMDFYSVDGHIYFGEYTFFNQSGYETGFDDYSDSHLGSLIQFPVINQ